MSIKSVFIFVSSNTKHMKTFEQKLEENGIRLTETGYQIKVTESVKDELMATIAFFQKQIDREMSFSADLRKLHIIEANQKNIERFHKGIADGWL